MKLYNEFCKLHPEFEKELDSFDEVTRKKLFRKLYSLNNKTAFRSTLSEIRFGQLFLSLGFSLEYDKVYDQKTPDWTLKSSSMNVICEVYRLGPSNKDKLLNDCLHLLKKELETIASNAMIVISIDDKEFVCNEEDIKKVKKKVEEWLLNNPKQKEELFIDSVICVRIISFSERKKNLTCLISGSIDYKPNKLFQCITQKPNEITKKIEKYKSILMRNATPFFLCVDVDMISGFTFEDFKENFLGRIVEFIDFDINEKYYTDIGFIRKEWTQLGEFYSNFHISGVILYSSNSFRILFNPIQKQFIYRSEYMDILLKLSKITRL
ncbi:hypothetical protein ACPDHQ_15995 [Myroides odoratimimus]|uniref:hypothetical protein n=1 Tax=Myroides odoratimimus TaxID=76832 RepID=UPI003D2F91D1